MSLERLALICASALALLALTAACTTTAPPSRLDTYLCGDGLVATERGTDPPAASCTLVTKWSGRGYSDPELAHCGPHIASKDVRVAEVGDVGQVTETYTDASGRYRLAAPGWMALQANSTDASADGNARRIAASAGCPLLLLGPRLTLEVPNRSYERGGVRVVRYRLFRIGSPAKLAGGETAAEVR
jgi:hypothetical protein